MKSLKKYVLVAVGFALAGMFGAAFGSGPAHALVAALVQIVNTAGNPVITQHVAADNPATQAVSLNCTIQNAQFCTLVNGVLTNPPYVVPTGKRLVIESLSGNLSIPTGTKFFVTYNVQDNTSQHYFFEPPLNFVQTFSGFDFYTWGVSAKLYAEQGTSVGAGVQQGSATFATVTAFGHLEDIQ